MFANDALNKELILQIFKELMQSNSKKTQIFQLTSGHKTWLDIFPKKVYLKGQLAHKDMLSITNHEGNAKPQ